MKAFDTFAEFSDFEKFACLVSVARPEFFAYPNWAKNVAYQGYQAIRGEQLAEHTEEHKDIINRVLWNASCIDSYCKTADKAVETEKLLVENVEKLKTKDGILEVTGLARFFEQETNDPNIFTYSVDLSGDQTVITAEYDDLGNTKLLLLHEMSVNIDTGRVQELIEESSQQKSKEELISKTAQNVEKPTKPQWRRYLAMSELLGENTMPIVTKKTMQRALYRLDKIAEERGVNPKDALEQFYAEKNAERESNIPHETETQEELTDQPEESEKVMSYSDGDIYQKIAEINDETDNIDTSFISCGRTNKCICDTQILTEQQAQKALELGIKISLKDNVEGYHGSDAGYYSLKPIFTPEQITANAKSIFPNSESVVIDPIYNMKSSFISVNSLFKIIKSELAKEEQPLEKPRMADQLQNAKEQAEEQNKSTMLSPPENSR